MNQIDHIVGIAAGKGGVGKSSVTVNLALSLQKMGYRVGILDADIYGPSIRKMLPEDRLPQQNGEKVTPANAKGIQTISVAYFHSERESSLVRAPIANRIIHQFIDAVEWEALDYLLIDFPPGTGDIPITLLQSANIGGVLLVTTPQEVALLDVMKTMQMFQKQEVDILGIVENMSFFEEPLTKKRFMPFGVGGGKKLADQFQVKLMQQLPIEVEISICSDRGESLLIKAPQSEATKVFLKLAHEVNQAMIDLKKNYQHCLEEFELVWDKNYANQKN